MPLDSVKRAIGQHFIVGFHGHELSADIKILVAQYFVGNVILMKRNIQSHEQVHRIVRELQQLAKEAGHERPLMIGIDQENGLVSAFTSPAAGTQFPGGMSLSSTTSLSLAQDTAFSTGTELKSVGINWAFSPVADINTDPSNPVIGVRSFGDDPIQVATFVHAVSLGLTQAGIAPSAKHFPGHGDTHVDSHLALPVINLSKHELRTRELIPFKKLINSVYTDEDSQTDKTQVGPLSRADREDSPIFFAARPSAGVASIMTGHIALPSITEGNLPASLSHAITTGLLREDMGYDGTVVTDCLEMDAIRRFWDDEDTEKTESLEEHQANAIAHAAELALLAGADVAMICHTFRAQTAAVERVWDLVDKTTAVEGDIPLVPPLWSNVVRKQSLARIQRMKDKFSGSFEQLLAQNSFDTAAWVSLKERNQILAKQAYDQSIAVISDPKNFLPLSTSADANGSLLLFTPVMYTLNKAVDDAEGVLRNSNITKAPTRNTAGLHFSALHESVSKRVLTHGVVHIVYDQNQDEIELETKVRAAKQIIFVTRNADQAKRQIECLQRVISFVHNETIPVVVLASCAPYDLLDTVAIRENIAYVASFEYTASALDAAVRVIFGEVPNAVGKVPVLNGKV